MHLEFDRRSNHNPKVTGLSPVPATRYKVFKSYGLVFLNRFFMPTLKGFINLYAQTEYQSAFNLSNKRKFT
jgi:hypothetical protein